VGQAKGIPLYIPPGKYFLSGILFLLQDNIVFHGAGPWWTSFFGFEIGIFGRWGNPVKNIGLYDFSVLGQTRIRNDGVSDSGSGAAFSNSIIQNIWIEHTKVGMWFDGPFTELTISGCTIRNTLADGINFHVGITNSVVQQTIIRNTADDGLAMWSDRISDSGNVFKFNTIQVPILANGIAIYGGNDNSATDNVVVDSVTMGGGLHAGNRFSAVPISGTTTFARNSVLRCGGHDDWFGSDGNTGNSVGSRIPGKQIWNSFKGFVGGSNNTFGGIFFWAFDHPQSGTIVVEDVQFIDSTFEAVGFIGTNVTNVSLNRVTITGAGTWAVREDCYGSAQFTAVTATKLTKGGIWNCGKDFVISQGAGNSGWNDVHCDPVPPPPPSFN